MKVKVSDYIANFFVEKGITDVFTVVGGGAMHMNDSFGPCIVFTTIMNRLRRWQQKHMQELIIKWHLYVSQVDQEQLML